MSATSTVESVLDEALRAHGFSRARRAVRWRRPAGANDQVVGLRRSRSGDGGVAVFMGEWPQAATEGPSFELSPVAPLSNTYWWPAALGDDDVRQLRAQVERVVLPFFACAARSAVEAANAVQAGLQTLRQAQPPFTQAADGVWWRERDAVIDLLIPELLAQERFVRLWVAVWHRELPQGLSGDIPGGVTHAAAHTVGRDGIDGDPVQALFVLQGPGGWAQAAPALLASALGHLEPIRSADDVLRQVRDEYRRSMAQPA